MNAFALPVPHGRPPGVARRTWERCGIHARSKVLVTYWRTLPLDTRIMLELKYEQRAPVGRGGGEHGEP